MSTNLTTLANEMERTLKELLNVQQQELEADRSFLLAVLAGRGTPTIEDNSTELTRLYTTTALSEIIPIEEAEGDD